MSIRRSPITSKEIDIKPAARKAVEDITHFLSIWYPATAIGQTRAALEIGGSWLSRIDGFHDADDFSNLVRDFLLFVQSGGERSRISDQIAYYFSGFMPTYGAACIFIGMVADRRPWSEAQAFMHTLSYGGARRYVETFDWKGGQKKADAEAKAWLDILKEQARTLDTATAEAPVLLAQAQPNPAPVYDVPPANDPVMPKPKPPLRVVPNPSAAPAGEVAAEGVGARLGAILLRVGGILLLPLLLSGDTRQPDSSETLTVPLDKADADAQSNTTNNECKEQLGNNRKNGAECEMDGYWLMEQTLHYKRLVNPPKGRGLDGLFEKLPPNGAPNPMPQIVTKPKPGKLLFMPESHKPPKPAYDFTAGAENRPLLTTYPKFVVIEGKHVSEQFDEKDSDGIKKKAKNSLRNTCDGKQLNEPWTAKRIPQALEKQYPKNKGFRTKKEKEIRDSRYARWLFVCLPGPTGDTQVTRLYVFIDVIGSGMDLESTPPKPRKSKPSTPTDNGY